HQGHRHRAGQHGEQHDDLTPAAAGRLRQLGRWLEENVPTRIRRFRPALRARHNYGGHGGVRPSGEGGLRGQRADYGQETGTILWNPLPPPAWSEWSSWRLPAACRWRFRSE